MALNRELSDDAEQLPTVGRTGAPRQEHFFHLAASGLVDDLICVNEQANDDSSEVASIRVVNILGDGVEEVERR